MKLENEFTVPVPVERAWEVMLDVERIAPCVPGATLTGVEDDVVTGSVKVKVGPIQMTYGGKARFLIRDEAARRVVIEASGKDTRGGGTAAATVTATLTDDGGTTRATVETDLTVTGRPAQFGRGVLSDVARQLIDQFASCLAKELAATDPGSDPASPAVEPAHPASNAPGAIDLVELTKGAVAKRVAPIAAIAALLLIWLALRRRRR